MIERAPPEARAELDRKLKAGEDAAALNIMRALRYFEMYPCHICHGALPPWGTCLLNCADVVDLSHETVDVDSFIVDVLMTKVVKAEPGRARALVKPEPGLEAGSLIGTEVRKRFPGVGWYDGVVLDASGGGGGSSSMAEVQWHDGSITDMKITDVQKYAKVAAERAGSGPNKRPAEKTTGVVNGNTELGSPGQPARKRVKAERGVPAHGGLAGAGAGRPGAASADLTQLQAQTK
jgi:hypothetical protein